MEVYPDVDPTLNGIRSYLMSGYPDDDCHPMEKPTETWIEVYNARLDPELYYWVILHEFGHLKNGDAKNWGWQYAYEACPGPYEARAWKWAFDNSRFEPSEKVFDQVYYHWFGTYYASPGFSLDDPDIAALAHYLEVETVE